MMEEYRLVDMHCDYHIIYFSAGDPIGKYVAACNEHHEALKIVRILNDSLELQKYR